MRRALYLLPFFAFPLLTQTAAAAPLAAETQCRVKMLKAGATIAKAQARETSLCLKQRAKGALTAEEATACLLADAKGRVAKAQARADALEATTCAAPPSFAYTGAAVTGEAAQGETFGLAHEIYGADPGAAAVLRTEDPAGAACQGAVQKAIDKVQVIEQKAYAKCRKVGLRAGTVFDAASLRSCLDEVAADPSGKSAKARAGVANAVAKKCGGSDLDALFPGACSGSPDHANCLADRASCRTCLFLSDADALDADCDVFDDGVANLSCIRCNGDASLCDRRFDEVVYPTSHNAMSNAAEGWLAPNNTRTMPDQLDAGIRSLMLDTWYSGGLPVLCHGGEIAPGIGCSITGEKPLADGLGELTTYLDTHPHEVLSIIFESYISEADTAAAFTASGLSAYVHAQSLAQPWPTLRDLITAGTRMVVFTDDSGVSLPWHHYVWSHAWETHFSAQEPSDFSCAPNRGSTSNRLFILNHFLTDPFALPSLAAMVNPNPFFVDRALQCQAESGDLPNFVTVDFEDIGDLYSVVRTLNGLP